MNKCGACGKFQSDRTAVAVCFKCKIKFHKACVTLSSSSAIPKDWVCPGCVAKVPRQDNTDTPVKGVASGSPSAGSAPAHEADDAIMAPSYSQAGDQQLLVSTVCSEETIAELITEIRMFREDLHKNRQEMATFRKEMHILKDDIILCKINVDNLAQKLTVMDERVLELERKRTDTQELQSTIEQLKRDLNDKDQAMLINDIEIVNIPETKNENPYHIISVLAAKLGTTCAETDIVEVYRAGPRRLVVSGGPPAHPRPLVVRVTRRAVKDRLLGAARVRRNVTTADMSLPGKATAVYLNERLTKENRRLFKKAKEEAKRLNWRYLWTSYGKIYTRRAEGATMYSIRSNEDIEKMSQCNELVIAPCTPSFQAERPEPLHTDVAPEPVSNIDGQTNVNL